MAPGNGQGDVLLRKLLRAETANFVNFGKIYPSLTEKRQTNLTIDGEVASILGLNDNRGEVAGWSKSFDQIDQTKTKYFFQPPTCESNSLQPLETSSMISVSSEGSSLCLLAC